MWFVSLKVLEATFCVGVKAKRPLTRNPVCIRETPVKVCEVCPRRQKILGTALVTLICCLISEKTRCQSTAKPGLDLCYGLFYSFSRRFYEIRQKEQTLERDLENNEVSIIVTGKACCPVTE